MVTLSLESPTPVHRFALSARGDSATLGAPSHEVAPSLMPSTMNSEDSIHAGIGTATLRRHCAHPDTNAEKEHRFAGVCIQCCYSAPDAHTGKECSSRTRKRAVAVPSDHLPARALSEMPVS